MTTEKGQSAALDVASGSAPSFDFPKIELLFADRDAYLNYVEDVVNPARAAAELETISPAVANACYNVVTAARWRAAPTIKLLCEEPEDDYDAHDMPVLPNIPDEPRANDSR